MRSGTIVRHFLLFAAALLLMAPAGAQKATAPQPQVEIIPGQPRRLILKDGSYQQTIRWEIKGERVHYFSAERYEWEDIPKSMVDWDATNKFDKERPVAEPTEDVKALDAEEAAERKAEEEKSPEIKPGLRLPSQGGVFLLDVWREEPELIELGQSGSEIDRNTGRNVLRATINPLAKAKQSIQIKGAHAQVQAHVPQPALYVDIDSTQCTINCSSAQDQSDHFRIVRLTTKKDMREVGAIEIAVYGKVTQKEKYVEARAEQLTSEWVKVTPARPLDPGEYALVEMMGKDVNLFVWDFGINPSAPQNRSAWKPAQTESTPPGSKDSPALNKRPKP